MVSIYRQLKTIIWKHYTVRKRQWLLTLLEIIIPIVIFVCVAYARSKLPHFDKEYIGTIYLEPTTDQSISTQLNVADTKIFYAPQTEFTDNLIREVQLKLLLYNEAIRGFRNRDDILRHYNEIGDEGITVVIIFDGVGHFIPEVLKYDIQMYEEMIYWETDKLFRHDIQYMEGVGSERYIGEQFIPTQWALETSFIEMVTNAPLNTSMTFQEFPYPPHWTDNGMTNVFSYLLPLLVILSFIFLFPSILRMVVQEKSSGIKQLMKINGLKSWAYWFGWFLNGSIFCILSVIAIVVLLTTKLFHNEFAPLEHANVGQMTLLLLFYCLATISFMFAFSTLFDNALLAMISGIILWFVVYIAYIAISTNVEIISFETKLLVSLLPNIALYYGIGIFSVGEIRGSTVEWTEQPTNSSDDITMHWVLLVLAFDTIFYIILAWAFDTDPTGKYKIAKCWKKSNKSLISLLYGKWSAKDNANEINEQKVPLVKHIEENSKDKVLLDIRNLRKVYGQVVALKGLTMKIYSGTTTALLGHNGAGKSTTMSILAGLTKETCGSVLLPESGEVDLKNRQLVSICPQENLLLPELTVKEHLQFFGMLKGLTLREVNTEVEILLKDKLNLYEKRHALVKHLSGGMKRKLAIGIAIMGKPKILILDEPTAGIDPEGRILIWDLISGLTGDTTILMSTHLIEEAEKLADRVAIIDDGELECYGTTLYLKDKYKVGFHFAVNVKDEHRKNDVRKLIRLISQGPEVIDEPHLLEYNFDHSDKKGIIDVMEQMNKRKNSLSISNCKMSPMMLEDVFHTICKTKESHMAVLDVYLERDYFTSDNDKSDIPNLFDKLKIMTTKKYAFLKNTVRKWTPMILIFYLLVLLTFVLGDRGYKDVSEDGKTLQLQLDTYGSQHIYYSMSNPNVKLQNIYESMVNMRSSMINTDNVSEKILERGEQNLAHYKTKLIVASEFITDGDAVTHINVMYSNQAVHGAPISLNLATNALIKLLTSNEQHSIIGSNTPLRSVNTKRQNVAQSLSDNLLLWSTLLPLGALFPAIISLLLPTIERNSRIKTMSLIYNMGTHGYWIGNYLIDLVIYVCLNMPVILVLLIAALTKVISLETSAILMFSLIFVIYGITIIPLTYVIASFSKSVASACASFLVPHMCISTVLVGVILTLEKGDVENAGVLRAWFAINPHFTLSYLLSKFCMKMVENHNWDIKTEDQLIAMCEEKPLPCCIRDSEVCSAERAYIEWDYYLLWTFLVALGCILFVIFLDSDLLKKMKIIKINMLSGPKTSTISTAGMIIHADKVIKSYTTKVLKYFWKGKIFPVNKLTFKVNKQECFALLGVNGAGKSTTFRMITKQELPSSGTLDINATSIGYCPQEHAMIGDLTGKEMLQYFAKLRNIWISDDEINHLISNCGLTSIADRLCRTYSGGNKRKLNTCIALIGNPEFIALDEPTTGVDPSSRLKIQKLIKKAKRHSGIVFTSHSMDECEKLCDKVAIMKQGKIENETTTQIDELKDTYAVGYLIQIKMKSAPTETAVTSKLAAISEDNNKVKSKDNQNEVPGTEGYNNQVNHRIIARLVKEFAKENVDVLDDRSNAITVRVRKAPWIELMKAMCEIESDEQSNIEDYIIRECSLEHVFLMIASDKSEKSKDKKEQSANIV